MKQILLFSIISMMKEKLSQRRSMSRNSEVQVELEHMQCDFKTLSTTDKASQDIELDNSLKKFSHEERKKGL